MRSGRLPAQTAASIAHFLSYKPNILRAVEAGVVPPGTDHRLAELAEERAGLERRMEEAAVAVPTVEDMAEWVRTRLCRHDPEALLRHAASRATIDERGVLRVEIPWRETPTLLENGVSAAQKSANAQLEGSSPNSSLVARTRFELVISALRGRRPEPLDERATYAIVRQAAKWLGLRESNSR